MKKVNIILLVILLFAAILRIIQLGVVPPSIANDEVNIVMNAESILKTGQNIPGVVTGILGGTAGDLSGGIHSELSSYILIPFLAIFGFSWPIVKIPFVFASLGLVYVSYLLAKRFINEQAGLFAAALSALNPWTIHFGRSAYESILSSFFYLLGIYLVLTKKSWKIFWSLPFLLLGFFSYFSAKTLLIPITIACILAIKFFRPRESLKPMLALNLLVVIFISIYGFLLSQTAANRFSELQAYDIKKLVDSKRTKSIDLPLANIFENKYAEDFKIRFKAALGTFSPTLLFLDGQPESIPSLSIPDQGPLYLIDFPLIVTGIIYLGRINVPVLIFLIALILTTLIPNFLNLSGTTYMIRTVILFPLLTILSAIGFYRLAKFRLHTWGVIAGLCYIILFGNFIYQYFGRMPVERADGFFLHQRVLARYAKLAESEGVKVIAIDQNPKHLFYRYLFFNSAYDERDEIDEANTRLRRRNYSLSNLVVKNECPKSYEQQNTYIVDTSLDCPQADGNSISNIKDGGSKYTIINDKVCGSFVKRAYPFIKRSEDLNVEKLSREKFCETFITSFNFINE